MYVERQHFHHEEQPREDRCDRRGQSDARPHPGPNLGPGLLAKPDDVGAAASVAANSIGNSASASRQPDRFLRHSRTPTTTTSATQTSRNETSRVSVGSMPTSSKVRRRRSEAQEGPDDTSIGEILDPVGAGQPAVARSRRTVPGWFPPKELEQPPGSLRPRWPRSSCADRGTGRAAIRWSAALRLVRLLARGRVRERCGGILDEVLRHDFVTDGQFLRLNTSSKCRRTNALFASSMAPPSSPTITATRVGCVPPRRPGTAC